MKKLIDSIEMINKLKESGKEVSIEVINKKNKEQGIVCLLQNNKEVKVFEGNPDGSDDRIYTIEEFDKNYDIKRILDEYEEEYE